MVWIVFWDGLFEDERDCVYLSYPSRFRSPSTVPMRGETGTLGWMEVRWKVWERIRFTMSFEKECSI